jgi:hypothetical protein
MRALLAVLIVLAGSYTEARQPVFRLLKPKSTARSGLPPVLEDIERHLPADHAYRFFDDLITWTHEGSHALCAMTSKPEGHTLLYCLEGRYVVLKNPDFTIGDVAKRIPTEARGRIFKTYLVDQRKYWDDTPLYLLDEWVAYTHGSLARKQMNQATRHETVEFMAEMYSYIVPMLEMTDDPAVHGFVDWNLRRCVEIAGDEWPRLPAMQFVPKPFQFPESGK